MTVPLADLTPSSASTPLGHEGCIVLLAPFGQDATLISHVLDETVESLSVPDVSSFCQVLTQCAAGILTTEALDGSGLTRLKEALRDQPLWSDIPLVVLSYRLDAASYARLTETLGNVTVIERPLQASSLISVVKSALRARQKQYQIRDLLSAEARQTEQIKALNSRLQRAMTETHHRVKNSLQLISAFVEMQALEYKTVVPVPELNRINTHIKTLAAVHEVLTSETKANKSGTHVSAKGVLEHLFVMLASVFGTNHLSYELEDIRLPARQATSLALAANELVLNALKHHEGEVLEIWVRFVVQGQKATLSVTDDGPGFPVDFSDTARSTGMELIDSLVRWDLEGEIHYENRNLAEGHSGARVVVEFDASRWNAVTDAFSY